jgi:hypothetical protein
MLHSNIRAELVVQKDLGAYTWSLTVLIAKEPTQPIIRPVKF